MLYPLSYEGGAWLNPRWKPRCNDRRNPRCNEAAWASQRETGYWTATASSRWTGIGTTARTYSGMCVRFTRARTGPGRCPGPRTTPQLVNPPMRWPLRDLPGRHSLRSRAISARKAWRPPVVPELAASVLAVTHWDQRPNRRWGPRRWRRRPVNRTWPDSSVSHRRGEGGERCACSRRRSRSARRPLDVEESATSKARWPSPPPSTRTCSHPSPQPSSWPKPRRCHCPSWLLGGARRPRRRTRGPDRPHPRRSRRGRPHRRPARSSTRRHRLRHRYRTRP